MRFKSDEGFTFIETIIVLTIILILSASIGFSAVKYIDRAKVASGQTQIDVFKVSLQSYYLDCGCFPTQDQGFAALWIQPTLSPVPGNWKGPYVDKEIPKDPWGHDYIYTVPGENNLPFTIVSFGADRTSGGENENADIVSWK